MHKSETDMSQDSDSNDQSCCSSPPLSNKQDSSDDMKKVQRREKNRIAAQKSRHRQTQKADTLHLESENLERENASLRKEIKQLTEELKYFSSLLSSHEPLCSGPALTQPAEAVYTTFPIPPHICSSRFQH
ncbi:basic leucine zipper transcriptional factor ATF-like [Microcaecilia unicolor]|uniref:Basic leucine zipper transcriptional factor ATF-like n=1 Tax=Microcaecilia unicolor TaxID=1415580 RepID=A0A6P7Z3J5_9AMPH|nr:basic leucine zipper transcriptional factor ATF-like [Microcaecilia unicolor]